MWPVLKREVKSYFLSPIGYVFIGLFLFLGSGFFTSEILSTGNTDYAYFIFSMAMVLTFVIPVLTMKLLAEERKTGTEQLLMTSPRSMTGIVLGKFFAALFVFIITLIITLVYAYIIVRFGKADTALIFGDYLGYFLLGAAYIAVGLFASSLTENQVVAAVLSFAFLLIMWITDFISNVPLPGFILNGIKWISLMSRYRDFLSGAISIDHIIFYLSFTALFIFLTIRVIERRRWKRG